MNVMTDEGNGWNVIWHWTNYEIGVAVKSWLWARVELLARYLCWLQQTYDRIQWSWTLNPTQTKFL